MIVLMPKSTKVTRLILPLLCLAGVAGLPAQIVAPAGRTTFNQTMMVRSFVRVDFFEPAASGQHVRRFINPYAVVWGAYPNLNLTFVAPLIAVRTSGPGNAVRRTSASFGDGAIFARYDLLRKNVPGGFTRLAPEIGLKVPSGGVFGSGSTDPIGTLVFSHVRDPHWFIADGQFTYTTENQAGLRTGNRWNYDLAYLYRALPRAGMGAPAIYLVLEMNGESVRQARLRGNKLADSGGNLVFLSPGVEFQPNNRLILEFAIPVPVVRDLSGSQLRPTWSLVAGVRWLL